MTGAGCPQDGFGNVSDSNCFPFQALGKAGHVGKCENGISYNVMATIDVWSLFISGVTMQRTGDPIFKEKEP